MGKINETLTLTDGFSASFRTFIDLGNQAAQTANMLDKNLTHAMGKSAGAIIGNMRQLGSQLQLQNQELIEAINNQQRWKEKTDDTNRSASKLLSTLRNAVAAIGAVSLTKSFLQTSDTMSQITAKLNMINDGQQDTAELQKMIYQSAQRSRASYADTANLIARVGQNAKEVFNTNAEMIQFAENLNKSFAIAGASQQEQSAATLQLTQALASGVLRGEELNSVFEAAPNVIRTIAEYLGVGVGEIREMAANGQITAEVVKNAMLSATDEINTQFQSMPMTLAQAFTMGKNAIQQALMGSFEGWSDFLNTDEGQQALGQLINMFTLLAQVGVGALSALGQGALWVSQNLDIVIPILAAIAVILVAVKTQAIAAAGANIAGALSSAAAWAVAHWPILLLAAALAIALTTAQQFGLGFAEVGGFVGQILGALYAVGYNVFASLWNLIATFAEFFANVFNDPVAAVAHLFFDVFDTILGIVETVAGAIDALLGSDLSSAVSGFRGKMAGWVDDTFGENAVQIKRMANLDVAATSQQWGDIGSNIGSKLDNMNLSLEDIAGGFGGLGDFSVPGAGELDVGDVGSVGNVKNIEGDVSLSDEDLKLYRDLAERRYMNQIELQTLAPQISVTLGDGANAKNLSPKEIANAIAKVLAEQRAAHTSVTHA